MDSEQMITEGRIEYIDCMRGFAMLLVVYCHVVYHGFGIDYTPVTRIIVRFYMPLFFFISGFMSHTPKPNKQWLSTRLWNRLLSQYVPALVVG